MNRFEQIISWIKNNKTRSIPIIGLVLASIFALVYGNSIQMQGVLAYAIWFIPLLLIREIKDFTSKRK